LDGWFLFLSWGEECGESNSWLMSFTATKEGIVPTNKRHGGKF